MTVKIFLSLSAAQAIQVPQKMEIYAFIGAEIRQFFMTLGISIPYICEKRKFFLRPSHLQLEGWFSNDSLS